MIIIITNKNITNETIRVIKNPFPTVEKNIKIIAKRIIKPHIFCSSFDTFLVLLHPAISVSTPSTLFLNIIIAVVILNIRKNSPTLMIFDIHVI